MPKREFKEAPGYVDEWKSMWAPDLEAIVYNGQTCNPTKVDPKVLQWVREHCDAHQPRFVKVLCATAAHGWHAHGKSQYQIFVPRPFVREHYRELGRVVTLESGVSHRKWKVSFGASPKMSSSWLQGWHQVAVDNCLRPGDVMVFVLVAHSHFRFHHFDENGNAAPETWNRTSTAKVECVDEDQVHVKKMPRLFDPDLPIVKTEPVFFHRSGSPAPIEEPPQPDDRPRLVLSDTTVTDGEEEITRDKNDDSRKSVDPITKLDVPQITVNTVPDELGDEVCGVGDGLVERRLEFEAVNKDVEAGEESGLVAGEVLQVAPDFNPLEYLVESKRRTTTRKERKRARDLARAYATETLVGCVGFLELMSEAKLFKDFHLTLPEQFVMEAGLPSTLTKVRLVDWDGGSSSSNNNNKTWEVYSRGNSCNKVEFGRKHWGLFALEHFLELGDVCVFQLMTSKDVQKFTISVRVFRVLDLVDQRPLGCSIWNHYEIRPKPVKS